MTLLIISKNFRNPNFKDLKDFLIAFLALGLISPLVIMFIFLGINVFSEKNPNQILSTKKEEKIVKEIAENYNLKLKEGLFESKHSRNIRLANEVIKIKLKETDISYEEYMSSLKGLEFYNSQKSLDPKFKSLTGLIFHNRHGYYHDAVCNIRYCPPK